MKESEVDLEHPTLILRPSIGKALAYCHYKIVVFDLHTSSRLRIRSVNRALVGGIDGLPDTSGLKPRVLADFLNEKRARATYGSVGRALIRAS